MKHVYRRLNNRLDYAMPIYGYDCNECGHQFEKLVRTSEAPSCPSCNSTDLKRQLSLIAQPAKGGGASAAFDDGGDCCGACPNKCH